MRLLYAADGRIDAYLLKALRQAAHVVEAAADPADAPAMAAEGGYEAIILDWASPPVEVTAQVARAARSAGGEALILVITARGARGQPSAVLRAGADACFLRPVSSIELEARLTALARLVRRAQPADRAAQRTNGAEMVESEQAVRLNGRSIPLSVLEFRLMAYLVAHAGQVIGAEPLQGHVWGEAGEPRPDLVRACIWRLRRKLEAGGAGGAVRAVAGHGYVFEAPPPQDHSPI